MLRSLRARLLILVLGSLCLLAAVTALLSALMLADLRDRAIASSRAELLQQSQQALGVALDVRLRQFGSSTAAAQRLAQLGAALIGQADPDDPALERRVNETLPTLLGAHPAVVRASFLRADRPPVSYPALSAAAAQLNASTHPLFAQTQPGGAGTGAPVWSGVHTTLAPDTPVLSVGVPVSTAGVYRGTLALDLGVRQLDAELSAVGFGPDTFVTLTDRDGRLLATSALGRGVLLPAGTPSGGFPLLSETTPALAALLTTVRAGQPGQANLMLNGREYLVAYGRTNQPDWSLSIYLPVDVLTSGATQVGNGISGAAITGVWRTLVIAGAITMLTGLLLTFWLQRRLLTPLAALNQGAAQIAAGRPLRLPPPPPDELGALMRAFGGMAAQVQLGRGQLERANAALEQQVAERTAALRHSVDQLETSTARQQQLLQTLLGLTAPIIPVAAGALALPLVGQFDAERVTETSIRLLLAAEHSRAHTVVIDLTGLALPDPGVVRALGRLITALRLIGATPILSGVGPETAQQIIALGLNLGAVQTTSSLAEAISSIRAG